jgi:hypothetical protein
VTLTVTTSVPPADTPRVQINITSSPSVTDALKVFRTHADGTVHRVLLEAGAVVIGTYVGLDFHAPFNQAVTYHAEAAGLVSAESSDTWLVSDDTWLVHRSDPDLSVMVEKIIGPAAPVKYPSRATRFQVLNKKLPVHRHDYPLGGETGTVVVKCESPESRAALQANRADDGVVLWNSPFTDGEMPWMWIQPGDLDISNPGGFRLFPFRYATLPYEETEQPDADSSLWTLDELKAHAVTAYPTLTDLVTAYAGKTLDDLKLRAL